MSLAAAWADGKLGLPLLSAVNGVPLGWPDAGTGMTFDFGTLIAHAARTRPLCAGTIIGSGTVSNPAADGGPGRPIAEGGAGDSCLAEQRVSETLLHGAPRTPFLKPGDRVRIEMLDGTAVRSLAPSSKKRSPRIWAMAAPKSRRESNHNPLTKF